MKKYLSDSKMFEYEKFSRECQKNNQPFIKARKNPIDGNYLVNLDLITCDYVLTKNKENRIQKLFDEEKTITASKNYKNPIFKGSNIDKEFCWYDGVLPKRLDYFCSSLFDLSCESS